MNKQAKQEASLTHKDLVSVTERKPFPRGCFRGELRDAQGGRIANIYVYDREVYIADPKEYGRGEIVKVLLGNPFSTKSFEKDGGIQLSASQRLQYWKFKV